MAVLVAFLLFILQAVPSFAATGRIKVDVSPASAPAGTQVKVTVKLLQGESSDAQPSTGEKAVIKIRDPKEGENCGTEPSPSDSNGVINGACTSLAPGTMTIYAESTDRGDSSEDKQITFTDKPLPSPTGNTQQQPVAGQTQGGDPTGQKLANQPGLAEDKNNGQQQGMLGNGLQPADDTTAVTPAPAVAGASDTSHGDIDLLNSLIYLTGGIILLIGGIYFIYIQASNQSKRKKEKKEQEKVSEPPSVV